MTSVTLHAWDWAFLAWSLAVTTGVGLYYARRAGKNLSEYLLSGRSLPWWALGTSMVATTFAADTPIVVSEFVLTKGIAGNWLWWNFLVGGTLTVFVFSRLWRRSKVVTEVELIAKRYDGRPAAALRAFKALYLGLLVNAIIFGWVTKAMSRVLEVVVPPEQVTLALGALIALTLVYTALSGLWGVVATDILQFTMAMIGAVLLAVLSVGEAGGLRAVVDRVAAIGAESRRDVLAIVPTGWNAFTAAVLVLVLVNWWAVYYPGAEPGGGGYVAQRMAAAKDEKHARAGTLWFVFAHYVLRPWPWILVALAALALEPRFLGGDPEGDFAPGKAYPSMFRVLPTGLLGLVVASFVAAYMSTITSQLNLAASYLVNDFYLPFVARKDRPPDDRAQVRVARGTVVAVTAIGCLIAWALETAGAGWALIMEATAGSGLVLVLRWLWWRVNAWSEIAAMGASAVACLLSHTAEGVAFLERLAGGGEAAKDLVSPLRLLVVVAVTTIAWLAATFATPPVGGERLDAFYRDVRPSGFWGPVAKRLGVEPVRAGRDVLLWAASSVFVLGSLFGVGSAVLLRFGSAAAFLAAGVAGGVAVVALLRGER